MKILCTISLAVLSMQSMGQVTDKRAIAIADSVKGTILNSLVPVSKELADSIKGYSKAFRDFKAADSIATKQMATLSSSYSTLNTTVYRNNVTVTGRVDTLKMRLDSAIVEDAKTVKALTALVTQLQNDTTNKAAVSAINKSIGDLSEKLETNILLSKEMEAWIDEKQAAFNKLHKLPEL